MNLKVKIVKALMKLGENKPHFDVNCCRTENLFHDKFVSASEDEKREMLLQMANNHFFDDQSRPFDLFFPGYEISDFARCKSVLDLGCGYGGKSVSYANRWNVAKMSGIEVNPYFVEAAKLFASRYGDSGIEYDFRTGFGEDIPFKDDSFDVIVAFDVFEHVRSLEDTLLECRRTLKSGGVVFTVFPSYNMPTESHLSLVSKTPCLHWFFSPDVLKVAYDGILEERGSEAYWYKGEDVEDSDWQILHGGIGINGTTFRSFREIAMKTKFSEVSVLPTPIFAVGRLAHRYPRVQVIGKILKPLLRLSLIEEYLSQRIVAVLKV